MKIVALILFCAALSIGWMGSVRASEIAPGWGIDAWLVGHASDDQFSGYLHLMEGSGIRVVRERGMGARHPDGSYDAQPKFRALKAAGFAIDCFAGLPGGGRIEQSGDSLPEDLLNVFEQGKILGRDFAGLVDAWEMVGEPDIGYCKDLPERTVAFQKALYLGIKAGAAEKGFDPVVMMGALALPPGPWLERAARNGLFDYTDACNFHFYGHAEDLTGVIRAHRAFAGPTLPLWVTECGMKAVRPDDFLDPQRRGLQAEFTVSTGRQALREGVAVFMPFILFENGDPYALTLSPEYPLPAWTAYSKLTREFQWPRRVWARTENHPNPVVLQWLPDNTTTFQHKMSGTYRFRERTDLRGELRIYNFGTQPVHGILKTTNPDTVGSTFPAARELTLLPCRATVLRGEFSPAKSGYFLARWAGVFVADDGTKSPLEFGLERTPLTQDFYEIPLRLTPPTPTDKGTHKPETILKDVHPLYNDYRASSAAGPWVGLNGVVVTDPWAGGGRFCATELTGDPVGDPLYPPQAVARIDGLPSDCFLRVRTDPVIQAGRAVRVDLVDDLGQRFTIWENFGQSYQVPSRELWLNLHDFQIYFWGRCTTFPQFRPERIRELQLRFYFAKAGDAMTVDVALMRPR